MQSKEEKVATYLAKIIREKNVEALLYSSLSGEPESAAPASPSPEQESAKAGLEEIKRGRLPTSEQTAGIEAIILPKIRPVLDVIDGDFRTDHPLWQNLNAGTEVHGRLQKSIPSIGRIELPGNSQYPYGGTGFVVGQDLVMTNRHVAAIFTSGVGSRKVHFKPGHLAGIDFLREANRPTGPVLMVKQVVMVHPYWDMALLAVEGLPPGNQPLLLSLRDPSAEDMIEVAAIGYPAFDIRNDTDVQNDLFRRVFGVKRLQPGTLGGRLQTESFGKMVFALRHNCSTLGGNSGSAMIDLDSGQVIALHFGGKYSRINFGVPACELATDPRVADAGVQFAGKTGTREPAWNEWWKRADEASGAEAKSAEVSSADLIPPEVNSIQLGPARHDAAPDLLPRFNANGSVEFVVPLHVTIRVGNTVTVEPHDRQDESVQRLKMPWHDEDYDSRSGYDPHFLDQHSREIKVPMPDPADPSVVATTSHGGRILHYQNFSIVMHRQRRIALFTASNATAEACLKRPEAGRLYTREGFTGLGKSDQERWFPDPRLSVEYQLPDVFYTRDDGAFDKGHIVRREDVNWGETYEILMRANGDTFHVTNCSPQAAAFDRSALGEDNWGDFENHVLKSAATERYCQFAGPVLDPADEVFLGRGEGGVRLKVRIPSKYWKVIVVRTEVGISSYGFVIEQDLSGLPFEEFTVATNFTRFMEPLRDIEQRAGIRFPKVVLNADQYGSNEGIELAYLVGVKRRNG